VALLDDHTSSRLGRSSGSVGQLEPAVPAGADDQDEPVAPAEPAAPEDGAGAASAASQPETDRSVQHEPTDREEADPVPGEAGPARGEADAARGEAEPAPSAAELERRPDVAAPLASASAPDVPSAEAPLDEPGPEDDAGAPETAVRPAEPAPTPPALTEHAPRAAHTATNDDVPDSGIRLLPGAERTRPGRSDLQQPSVAPRDVDVLLGAAAADAAARVDAASDPMPDPDPAPEPPARDTTPRPAARRNGSEPSAASPVADRLPVDEPRPEDTAAEPAPAASPTEPPADVADPRRPEAVRAVGPAPAEPVADPVDVTDELPRIQGGPPRPGRRDPDEPERDDLRTTAQLAILIDDLRSRSDES
jgi:nicotinate-nucleotide--dimethylbenzimidazole phosphoribosyltransferase